MDKTQTLGFTKFSKSRSSGIQNPTQPKSYLEKNHGVRNKRPRTPSQGSAHRMSPDFPQKTKGRLGCLRLRRSDHLTAPQTAGENEAQDAILSPMVTRAPARLALESSPRQFWGILSKVWGPLPWRRGAQTCASEPPGKPLKNNGQGPWSMAATGPLHICEGLQVTLTWPKLAYQCR